MINKQNLWFLTLFSLILVLSVYYVTMPNELLETNTTTTAKETTKESADTTIEETTSLTAMRVSLEEEREAEMTSLQETLTSDKTTTEEKNNAYEQLKYLNELQGKEEELEKKIKEKYETDSFVKIENKNVSVVAIKTKHDTTLANNIMRLIQESSEDKLTITVSFKKS